MTPFLEYNWQQTKKDGKKRTLIVEQERGNGKSGKGKAA
jgi:hypothetical protein